MQLQNYVSLGMICLLAGGGVGTDVFKSSAWWSGDPN